MIIQALSSYQELQKSVKSEYTDNKYNTSDVSTLLNDSYSYKLKFKTGNSAAKNLVIYDDLETAENSEWKGTFKSIDLSYLEDKGYNPTILYSTIEIPGDISNKNNWSTDKPANDKIAPNKCVKPFIGSLAYLAIICIPPLYINLILIDTLILV